MGNADSVVKVNSEFDNRSTDDNRNENITHVGHGYINDNQGSVNAPINFGQPMSNENNQNMFLTGAAVVIVSAVAFITGVNISGRRNN